MLLRRLRLIGTVKAMFKMEKKTVIFSLERRCLVV